MKKNRLKIKTKNFVVILICIVLLIISVTNIISWAIDSNQTKKEVR